MKWLQSLTFERLAVLLLFLAIFGAACLMPAQSDTFWQLRAGADTIATGRVQLTDTWTHTVKGAYWPNHEWASEVAFYVLHRLGGFPLLTLALALIVTSAWWTSWRLMTGPTLARVAIVAVLAVSSARLWSLRPQAISLLLLVVVLRLLAERREWWLPLVFLVWANFHGGVLLGIAALAGAVVARAFVTLSTVRRGSLTFFASILAACVTPLGPSLFTEVGAMVERIRVIQIQEWQPTRLTDPWNLPFWISAVVVLCLAWRRRAELSTTDAVVIGGCLALTMLGVRTTRNVMPALMLMAPAVSRLAFPITPLRAQSRRERPFVNGSIAVAAVAFLCVAVVSSWAKPSTRLNWRPLPVDAAQAIATCPPNLYNLYDYGGYIAWFVPEQPVFVDGRQDPFPSTLILGQVDAERAGDYVQLFRRHNINCAALPAASKVAQALIRDHWYLAANDGGWLVLVPPPGVP